MTESEDTIFKRWNPASAFARFCAHPTSIYESERLASVEFPTLNDFELQIKTGEHISDFQVEAISCAVRCFEDQNNIEKQTRGFILGDGTGTGKSRTISGIIAELYARDKNHFRVLWVSLNSKLERTMQNEYQINDVLQNPCPKWISIDDDINEDNCVMYATYANFLNDEKFKKIYDFLNSSNTLIIFDESHVLKNKNSQTSKRIMQLQNDKSDSRVLYSTATSASDVRQMHYMCRLGLFEDHKVFVQNLEYYGDIAMEMTAIQLKFSGHLISRQLGLQNIKFNVDMCRISADDIRFYNYVSSLILQKNDVSSIDKSNFFQYLISSIKMKYVVSRIQEIVSNSISVVIGLNSTCEGVMGRGHSSPIFDLLQKYDIVTDEFVSSMLSPLDYIINQLGPEHVAEITGRTKRLIYNPTTKSYEQQRVPSTSKEIAAFQRDDKHVAIISRAGNAGISLHASKANSRQRHHIIFEIPKSADLVVQQIGRTFRTSVNSTVPLFSFFVSNIPAEMRYVNGIVKKLQKLGAITKGDTRASVLNNIEFNGCGAISKRANDKFILDLNISIAKSWFENHSFDVMSNVQSMKRGLIITVSKFQNKNFFFSKVLSCLNEFIIDDVARRANASRVQTLANESTHPRYWARVFECFIKFESKIDLNDTLVFTLLTVLFDQIPVFLKHTAFENFSTCGIWTQQNHAQQSPYVKSVVKTLLLCKTRPECQNTLGKLPTDVFYTIIPFLSQNDTMKTHIATHGTTEFKNEIFIPQKSNSNNVLLNKLFELNISTQQVLFSQLRYHVANTEMYQRFKKNVVDLDEFILKSHKHEYSLVFDSFEKKHDEYEIQLSIKRKVSLKDISDLFDTYLKPNMVSYVRRCTHAKKFGILLATVGKQHAFEIWYPGDSTPSHIFMEYQIDSIRKHFIYLSSISDANWNDEVKSVFSRSTIDHYKYVLQLSVENAIEKWSNSHGVLLKIENSNLCRNFVGLLLKYRRFG